MMSGGRDSLFSLEVIVDQLVLSSVTCRFPAVAFRLLDFPTLLVEHVEPELADRIKKKISIEMQANLPRQLKELQDKNGAFLVKRGKSCLFKIANDTLQIHLSNTPLYVLVIDTFPDTPKLVASCLIPLNDCMDRIRSDIEKVGITVPHVHGEKGQYKLYNLMGIEVGHVDIACRLLSLGEGLMQHIPDHAIAKFSGEVPVDKVIEKKHSPRKEKSSTPRKSGDGSPRKGDDSPRKARTPRHVVIMTPPKFVKDDDLVVEDLEAPEKAQPIIISSAKDVLESVKQRRELESSGTQTELPRKPKHVQFPSSDLSDELDNVYLTNTFCPPPLFYNSTAEEKLPPSKLEVYEYHSRPAKPLDMKDFDTESVRSDDVLFDLIEQGLDQTLIKPSETKFIHYQHSVKPPILKQPDLQQMLTSPDFHAGQFPFLRALTAELAFLQNTEAQSASQSQGVSKGHHGVPQKAAEISQQKNKSPRNPRTPREVQLSVVPPAEKENKDHFLARLSTPKKKLPEKQGPVPSYKGWLRKEPVYGQRKTKPKFSYGMTNTQRLRLAQVNPDLLHSLEIEQEELKVKKQQEQFDNMTNVQKAMAKTFVLNPAPRGKDVTTVDSRTMVLNPAAHKKPVPTPRRVSVDDNASIKEVSPTELMYDAHHAQAAAQRPFDHPDTPTGKLDDLVEADYEPSGSSSKHSGSSSQRSIKVRVPVVSMNESASYSTDADADSRPPSVASQEDLIPVKEKPVEVNKKPPKSGQVRSTFPGFPAAFKPNDTQTTQKTESTLHYTDEFEDSKQWMSTDEPELQALRYSYSESGDDGSESRTLTEEATDPTDDGVRTSTTIRIPIVNPKASLNSPKAAIKKSASFRAAESTARTIEGDSSSDKGSSSPTPKLRKSVTPPGEGPPQRMKLQHSVSFEFDEEEPVKEKVPPPYPRKGTKSAELSSSVEMSHEKPTPQRRANVGRSPSAESVESPTRQRRNRAKPKLESIHTESVSSYMPSDLDLNMTYDSDEYSDDFDNSEGAYQPTYKHASEATVAHGAGRLGYTWN